MDTGEIRPQADQCGGNSPQQGESSCACGATTQSRQGLKIMIFIVVMLLAGAVAAHSLLRKNSQGKGSLEKLTSSLDSVTSPADNPAPGQQPGRTAAGSCTVILDSIESAAKLAVQSNANVLLILLADDNAESVRSASAQIDATVNMLRRQDKRIAACTLAQDAEGCDELVKMLSIESLPAVIISGLGCGAVAVSGQITADKLLSAFVKATTPGACSGSSSCCPAMPKP